MNIDDQLVLQGNITLDEYRNRRYTLNDFCYTPGQRNYMFEYNNYNSILRRVTMTYRSSIKKGYTNTGIKFGCRQSYRQSRESKYHWLNEMCKMLYYVKQQRLNGVKCVVVVHGYNHPNPDIVTSYIYTHPSGNTITPPVTS